MPRFNPIETNKRIGRRIRQRRDELGLTQRHLADALGLSFQQVQKYESGKDPIKAAYLFELSQFMNVPMAYFATDATTQSTAHLIAPAYAGGPMAQITVHYGQFSASGQYG